MPISNQDIAKMFENLADLLEIKGANPFRIRAYRNGARVIDDLSRPITELIEGGEDLTELPGIGKELANKIARIVETGGLSQLAELEAEMPAGMYDLLKIPGLGPKKIKSLYQELEIGSVEQLKKAAESQQIRKLKGFGKKTEQNILDEIRNKSWDTGRIRIDDAEKIARSYKKHLEKANGAIELAVAGSLRRRKETAGDLDILAVCEKGSDIMERFVGYENVEKVVSRGNTRSTTVLNDGLHVDLRVVPEESFGAALQYFTGSKAHNVAVRKIAGKQGLKINEYGVFRGDDRVAGKTEEEIYALLGMPFIEPELREDRGEIEAAAKNELPRLVRAEDILGDLHCHTDESDGRRTLEEMVRAAYEKGYRYLAVSNHSKSLTIAHGLDEKRLEKEIEQIDALQEQYKDFTILKSIEVDILKDGSLDLSDDVLKKLDFRICSVHSEFKLSRKKQTERIIRAMDNPYFSILGHPTGRLINQRKAYDVDLERVMEAAKERGCYLELNAHPQRLDLDDTACRRAREMGIKVAISTDAHGIGHLEHMRFGVGQARRGWLGPEDVLNAYQWKDLKKLLKRQ